MTEKNNPKIIKAWTFYDWANSVYSLVITSAIFPVYYASITHSGKPDAVKFLGLSPETAFDFSLAISFLLVIILSPVLSSIADLIGNKLKFLKIFCAIGSVSCILLFFFSNENLLWLGLLLNITASVGYWGSLVFYNAFLPEIATEEKLDSVSARGFITGYIGSVILLVICLAMIMYAPSEKTGFFTRLSFLLTGIWWIGFAQYTFSILPNNKKNVELKHGFWKDSFRELKKTWQHIKQIKPLKTFVFSYFFYSLGMQTIFLMAALFGSSEIGLSDEKLILTILLIQLEAILGAWIFSKLSGKIGNKTTLLIAIAIWIFTCLFAYFMDTKSESVEYQFYIMASLVGLVMGGIQSISRSTYSKLLPETEDTTTFFSFYDISEKIALFIGLLIFGILIEYSGGMKISALAMSISFAISFVIMLTLKYDFLKKK